MPVFGIDISKWQKGFNFDRAVAEGVQFVILRGAYKMSKDVCFEDFYKACKARGLDVGVYHYSMARTVAEAKAEANYLIANVLKGKQFEYPIYMDVEDQTQRVLGRDKLTDIVAAYCEIIEAAGYYAGIYSSASFFRTYMDESRLLHWDKWVAQWSKKCTYAGDVGLWQFGGETNMLRTNKVAGVTCDQDYALKDYPALIKAAGVNGFGVKKPEVKKSVDVVAREVIAGKWGNGDERRKRLAAAGYSITAVQKKVNELLTRKSVDLVAREVIAGKWGVGEDRKRRLTAAGYDYKAVQAEVNRLV